MAPTSWNTMGQIILPVACKVFSSITEIKQPKEKMQQMEMYWSPIATIS